MRLQHQQALEKLVVAADEAFASGAYRPICDLWLDRDTVDDGRPATCALGAVCLSRGFVPSPEDDALFGDMQRMIVTDFGVPDGVVEGLTDGWDHEPEQSPDELYHAGYLAGRRLARRWLDGTRAERRRDRALSKIIKVWQAKASSTS